MNRIVPIKKLVYGGVFIALGVLFPQIFHIFGQSAGRMFLPMHIPIILAGLVLGPAFGAVVALIAPLLSSLITGMPAVPTVYFMLFELIGYAVAAGFLAKKVNIYINLIITIVFGRLIYGLSLILVVNLFGMNFPFANTAAFFSGIVTGLPGIAIQLIFIPPIMFALKKGGLLLADKS